MLYAKWKREISLEYLSEEKFMPFGTTDEYFAQPPINEDYPFTACGQIVLLSTPALAAALSMLPQQKQEEIFLYYFQHCTQKEIGKQYGRHAVPQGGIYGLPCIRYGGERRGLLKRNYNLCSSQSEWEGTYISKNSKKLGVT